MNRSDFNTWLKLTISMDEWHTPDVYDSLVNAIYNIENRYPDEMSVMGEVIAEYHKPRLSPDDTDDLYHNLQVAMGE